MGIALVRFVRGGAASVCLLVHSFVYACFHAISADCCITMELLIIYLDIVPAETEKSKEIRGC